MSDYTYETVEAAIPQAQRYCKRDGITWIMRDKNGKFHIIYPYCESVKNHYLKVNNWTVEKQFETVVQETQFAPA